MEPRGWVSGLQGITGQYFGTKQRDARTSKKSQGDFLGFGMSLKCKKIPNDIPLCSHIIRNCLAEPWAFSVFYLLSSAPLSLVCGSQAVA